MTCGVQEGIEPGLVILYTGNEETLNHRLVQTSEPEDEDGALELGPQVLTFVTQGTQSPVRQTQPKLQ